MKNPSTLYAKMQFERLTGIPALVFRSNTGSMRNYWTVGFTVPKGLEDFFKNYHRNHKGGSYQTFKGIKITFLNYYNEKANKVQIDIAKEHLIEAIATIHTEKEIEAFREGVKWGVTLFAHTTDEKNFVVGQKGHNLEDVKAEVDTGKWDAVMDHVNDNFEA